ncbi:hypothetical protein GGF32_008555 [Allomyces javanicus]|nr:hypothetical protein GGF32_008555 [Allomyces javanicus]
MVAIAAPILEGIVLHFATQRAKPDPVSTSSPPNSSLRPILDPPAPDSPARRPRGAVPLPRGRTSSRRRSGILSGTSLPSDRMPLLDGEHLPSHEYRTFLGIPPAPVVDRAGRDRQPVRSQSYSETVHGTAPTPSSEEEEEEEETPRPRPRKASEGDAPPAAHRWSIAAFDSSRLAAIFRTGAITAFSPTSAARSVHDPAEILSDADAVVAPSDLDPHDDDDEDRLTHDTAPSDADLVSDDGDSLYISCPTSATTSEDDDDHEDELDEEIERHGRDTRLLARSPPAFLRVTQSPWSASATPARVGVARGHIAAVAEVATVATGRFHGGGGKAGGARRRH